MSKEEKSLLDELWDAAGLNSEEQKTEKTEEKTSNQEIIEEKDDIKFEKLDNVLKKEEIKEEVSEIEEAPAPAEVQTPAPAPAPTAEPAVKKKDIKFLVIYTIVFVVVISALIGGSYAITSRIHQQMAENNEDLNTSQSTLKNIQDENAALRAENTALKAENEILSASAEDAQALLDSVGDMVEQDGYLSAAQSAFIDGEKNEAKKLMKIIDREKLSQPAKEHYDLLKEKLGL